MSTDAPILLEISLVETAGAFLNVGRPRLYLWYNALHLGSVMDEATVSLLVCQPPAGIWHEYTVPVAREQSAEIVQALEDLGIPGRTLDVSGVVDTSDGWSRIGLHVRRDTDAFHLNLDMHSSGYEGGDAHGLRLLFTRLLALVGQTFYTSLI